MSDTLQLARAAVESGDFVKAADGFSQRLAQAPDDAASRAWLGQCLCSLGRRIEGISHLRRAGREYVDAARRSGETGVVLELAGELQHWRDLEGSLELVTAATAIDGSQAYGFQLLTLTYAQLNRVDEALEAARRSLELSPGDADMLVLQASLLADAREYVPARESLERLLAGRIEPRLAFRAHKELARILDKLGAHDAVFPHLHQAARLSASLPEFKEFDVRMMPEIIRGNRFGFDPDLLGRWAGTDFPQPAPVFVVGFMRSGTTLTQEVLGAHPGVFVSDEADFITQTLRELHRMNPARLGTAQKLRELKLADVVALRRFYWKAVEDCYGEALRGKVFVDKFTMNTIDAGFINAVFPDGKLIFVQRDPRDVCLSCFMQLMVPSLTTVQLMDWERTGRFYAQVMDWWFHIRGRMTMKVHEFRYEDAIADFEGTFRKVFDFAGLTWDPRVLAFHERVAGKYIASPSRNQVAQPLYASSVARWRRYAGEFEPLAQSLRPFVEKLGYAES